jgi:membrane-associated phospholipid phosphatase
MERAVETPVEQPPAESAAPATRSQMGSSASGSRAANLEDGATVSVHYAPIRGWMWGAAVGLFALALFLDGAIIGSIGPAKPRLSDFHMMLRIVGTIPTWLIVFVAVAAATAHLPVARRIRAEFVLAILTGALAAACAAILKPLVRRPDLAPRGPYEGWAWAPLGDEPWDGTDLCFPSEHAAVAWGVCVALSRMRPSLAWVLIPLGFGAASARVMSRGHHPSDVIGSLLVAMLVSGAVSRLSGPAVRWQSLWTRRPVG